MKPDPDNLDEQREEMQRLIGQTIGFISRGLPGTAARYAARAAELGKVVGKRWHKEPSHSSEQLTLDLDDGWSWTRR